MARLTQIDNQGNWRINGLPWSETYEGKVITKNTREKMYGAFYKLLNYEDTGLDPEQIREMDELYAEKCKELAKHRWIPVTERLPEVEDGITDEECPEFIVAIKDATVSTTLKYSPDGTWFDNNGYVYSVVAWMPLPEPYKDEIVRGDADA